MRWVFASLLASLVTVVLFFGIMRLVEESEEEVFNFDAKKYVLSPEEIGSQDILANPMRDYKELQTETAPATYSKIIRNATIDSEISCGDLLEYAVPQYPPIHHPLEADCETEFLVDLEGRPFDIKVRCDEKVFEATTRRAISSLRFQVTGEDGETCPYIGRIEQPFHYPMQYRLE